MSDDRGGGKTVLFFLGMLVGMLVASGGVGWYASTKFEEERSRLRVTESLLRSAELQIDEERNRLSVTEALLRSGELHVEEMKWAKEWGLGGDEGGPESKKGKASRPDSPEPKRPTDVGEVLPPPRVEDDKE